MSTTLVLPAGLSARLRSGIGLALLLALATALGPFLVDADPDAQDLLRTLEGPSADYPLGTDHLGRDMLARLVHGGPRSLGLAVLCVAIAMPLGSVLGLLAASGARWRDQLIMRTADLALAFPGILLALLLAGLAGGGILPMVVGLNLTQWPQFARMSRAVARTVLQEEHVEAAMLAGFSMTTILRRHVLTAVLRQTMPLATLGLGSAIMSISALGFLGLGIQPPTPEWGAMISELLPYLQEAPLQMSAPCIAIFLAVLAASLAGEALSEKNSTSEGDRDR